MSRVPFTYAPGDLAGFSAFGTSREQDPEPCPGCAGVIRDGCDACASGRTRHILNAGEHSLCLCQRCYRLLLQLREESRRSRPKPHKKPTLQPTG